MEVEDRRVDNNKEELVPKKLLVEQLLAGQ
jgi:hypothetical protein